MPANVAYQGVVGRICGSPQPELQRPAASPRPCRIINFQRVAEDVSRSSRQIRPGHHEVACWIAHSEEAEVNHGAELMFVDQQVGRMKVAMDPERLARPRGYRQGCLPYLQQRADIQIVLQNRSRSSGVVIVSGQRNAAEFMDGAASWVDRPQSCDEPSQARCGTAHVSDTSQGREL